MKFILANSGGRGSLAVAKSLHDQGHEVHSVYVNFGLTISSYESISASAIANKYCVDHQELELIGLYDSYVDAVFFPYLISLVSSSYAGKLSMTDVITNVITGHYNLSPTFETTFNDSLTTFNVFNNLNEKEFLYNKQFQTISNSILGLNSLQQVYDMIKTDDLFSQTISCTTSNSPCGICEKCVSKNQLNL